MNPHFSQSTRLGAKCRVRLLVLVSVLAVTTHAQAASVRAFVNAYTFGQGRTIIDDTLPGPSIERSVNVGYDGPRFSSGEVEVDLRTAQMRLRTDGLLVSTSDSAGVLASMIDTVTFDIDQDSTQFIEVEIRFHLVGTLLHNYTGGNSVAILNMDVRSFDSGGLRDLLIADRQYTNNPSIDDGESVTAADPDGFVNMTQSGDIVFDNSDYGLVQGTIRLYGPAPSLEIDLAITASGLTDFYSVPVSFEMVDLPSDVIYSSESGFFLTAVVDADSDGIEDAVDNCTLVANSAQVDTDSDGYGNACDADFNNDCVINFVDIAAFSNEFLGSNALFDLNNDGVVNFLDFIFISDAFLLAPGPGLGACGAD